MGLAATAFLAASAGFALASPLPESGLGGSGRLAGSVAGVAVGLGLSGLLGVRGLASAFGSGLGSGRGLGAGRPI